METTNTNNWRAKLFTYMNDEHDVMLLDSDMDQIQRICYPPDYPYIAYPATNTKLTAEAELIYKIVEQWGNAACGIQVMEQWLKDYAAASAPAGEMTAEPARTIKDMLETAMALSEKGGAAYNTIGKVIDLHLPKLAASQKKGQESKE